MRPNSEIHSRSAELYSASPAPDYVQPAEWEEHEGCWLAWPSHGDLWRENLAPARIEFVALCRAIADVDPVLHFQRGERLEIMVPDAENEALAREALSGIAARFHRIPFGDIWLRDTAPIFVRDSADAVRPTRFRFNGWGGKYDLPDDPEVSERIAAAHGGTERNFSWVLEGGAVEVDGQGTCITTEQCLLNPNRNPGISRREVERRLESALGIRKVIWLREGLMNDHTDGHVDTLARFACPGTVLCMEAGGRTDPNYRALAEIAAELEGVTDARGNRLHVIRVPSPGAVTDEDGRIMAASYMNFYIGNSTVVVPTYGMPADREAVSRITKAFPGRKVVGLSAKAILSGGGAFHCITQQVPRSRVSLRGLRTTH